MNRHKSSISRELGRNRGRRSYRPKQAHAFLLRPGPSPKPSLPTCGVRKRSPPSSRPTLSPASATKPSTSAFTTLHRTLRCQKVLRKRYGGRERCGTIANHVSIEQRPAIVSCKHFDDWEGDLVIGAGQHQALVTLNERKSRYSLIAHVPFKTAQAVSDTMISLLTPFAACVHTLTTDNSKEFAQHERIAGEFNAQFFFAHPYASWERGANENMNRLIRQFFPKKVRFDSITGKDTAFAMHRLDYRPRNCLGFKTPHEVFMKQLHTRSNAVALQT